MKNKTTILLIIIFLAGCSILLYPTVSDYVNSQNQSRAIKEYDQAVSQLSKEDYTEIWNKANDYNIELLKNANRYKMTEKQKKEYDSLLDVAGNGIMGYIEIGKIGVRISIGHGTSEEVLNQGVGHMEGTSLPCGGESTHAALVGHRGLPSAKIFTDLDQVEEGDTFTLHILNQILTYQVDKITVVEPSDLKDLEIEEGKDYVTLVTCTPYAVNTHRLLIRGTRIENENSEDKKIEVIADAKRLNWTESVPIFAAPILIIIFIFLMLGYRKKRE